MPIYYGKFLKYDLENIYNQMYPHHKSGYTVRCGKYEEERMKTSRKIGKIPQTATNDYNPAHAVQKETWRREKIIQSGCKQNTIIIRR
jgi:hypothetical protein